MATKTRARVALANFIAVVDGVVGVVNDCELISDVEVRGAKSSSCVKRRDRGGPAAKGKALVDWSAGACVTHSSSALLRTFRPFQRECA